MADRSQQHQEFSIASPALNVDLLGAVQTKAIYRALTTIAGTWNSPFLVSLHPTLCTAASTNRLLFFLWSASSKMTTFLFTNWSDRQVYAVIVHTSINDFRRYISHQNFADYQFVQSHLALPTQHISLHGAGAYIQSRLWIGIECI